MTVRELLLIGGGAGVGKTSVGWEVSALLRAAGTAHCFVEGDFLDQVHPAPPGDPHRTAITERNLASVWANYAALGQSRLIYTNTVSVLEEPMIRRAMGAGPPVRVTSVLLTAGEATVRERLAGREVGSQFEPHVTRGLAAAGRLAREAPAHTVRVPTDGRSVVRVAERVVELAGW
ncbi:nucleoside/nucleotide kinase family protein [Saccharothrix syringae]|uniref:ATPase n=1 Tax=Saccharothrix syringae TaxID=103733 RepID=A0A5Q0H296_SACSY|nr:hypothetical protein [Saccharothrix syringae]QFZ19994.1 hypothetical protein EKG83_23505 [Saccharothrix syringae]